MIPYSVLIDRLIPGNTPMEKFENLKFIVDLLNKIAYPKRGTSDETMTIDDVAKEIQTRFLLTDFPQDGG